MVAIIVGITENFRCPKVRRPSNDEKAEDTRIRERLRNLPAWKKDFSERKQRGPMVCTYFVSFDMVRKLVVVFRY